jgi:hypothetical protein
LVITIEPDRRGVRQITPHLPLRPFTEHRLRHLKIAEWNGKSNQEIGLNAQLFDKRNI